MIYRSSFRYLILVGILSVATCLQAIEPPPQPKQLSAKERTALVAIYESLKKESSPVSVGSSEQELLRRMGKPDGIMTVGEKKRMSYGSGNIVIANGTIIEINDVPDELLSTPNREAFEDYMRATGKVHYMGEWMTYADAREIYDKALQDQELTRQRITVGKSQKAVREQQIAISKTSYYAFKRNGAAIELSEMLAPGRVTVVDFYADWCAPCKAMDPYLRGLANDPEVAIRKVDIVNWGSPVAKQWDLKSIPNVRVYDRNGNLVGEPTHDIRILYQYIRRAKRG